MTNLSFCSKALKAFKEQYPNVTSEDLQTFILGFTAGEEIIKTITTRYGKVSAKFIRRISDNRELFLYETKLFLTDVISSEVIKTIDISDMFLY